MASLMGIKRAASNRTKIDQEKNKNAAFCKKHPKHKQSPGVCSLCLNEKLSHFIKTSSSANTSRRKTSFSSSSSSFSSYCSSSVSSCPSPLVIHRHENGVWWMKKSRSVAYDHKRNMRNNKKKKSNGFFFGLVRTRRENKRS